MGGAVEHLTGRAVCGDCGVANTDPWPTPAELSDAYADWYRPSSGRFSGAGDAILRHTRGSLARRLDDIAPPGPILDVGAGDGTLLDALKRRGRDAVGLERESSRSDIRAANLNEIHGYWAAIIFWHSLEHLPNPGEDIAQAASLLASRGVLVIAAPNVSSLQAVVFGDRWLALDLPRHLVHLTPDALIDRLKVLSLNVERVSYWRGGQVVFGWLHGLVGMLPRHPDLYDAIRRPAAQHRRQSWRARTATLALATLLMPAAILGAATEVALGRGGTIYVEARRG
jgi:SAM-dependent methyltransferase